MEKKIVIVGAGPTGLGAAYRLRELDYANWMIFEQNDFVGGLAASFRDARGFTWDIGGHIIFSRYEYFNRLLTDLLRGEYLEHQRNSWIWLLRRFVPYPFQNNIRYLPKEVLLECLMGLIEMNTSKPSEAKNFREWIVSVFGEGIARYFMFPYNLKNWAFPLERMSKDWIAERVSVIDVRRILENIIYERDDIAWGPNNAFRFPKSGGTGAICNALLPFVESKLRLNKKLVSVRLRERTLRFSDGTTESYDVLINTTPLENLVRMLEPAPSEEILTAAAELAHAGGLIVGVGLRQPCPSRKCWMYFPEADSAFYRVTYFSNYSAENAPGANSYSLMCETSYSEYKPESVGNVIDRTVSGLISSRLLDEKDRKDIISTFLIDAPYTYPVPTLERDRALRIIMPFLREHGIYSRGRFGLWLYEIGNTDHSVMQGKELVDFLLRGESESVVAPFARLL
jgi:protoporphyrinogen oxidase